MANWRVEVLNRAVEAEIAALPVDIRAKLAHIAELMVAVGPQRMREPHVKPLRDKLWEMRMRGQDGIHGRSMFWRTNGGSSFCTPLQRKRRRPRPKRCAWP